jgi:hypothetical protein
VFISQQKFNKKAFVPQDSFYVAQVKNKNPMTFLKNEFLPK